MPGKKGKKTGTEQNQDVAAVSLEAKTSTRIRDASAVAAKNAPPTDHHDTTDPNLKDQVMQHEEMTQDNELSAGSTSALGKGSSAPPDKPTTEKPAVATRRSARSTAGSRPALTGDHHHEPLDEPTLDGMYGFLATPRLREDKLIEDELLVAVHRTHKTALQRARSFRALGNHQDTEDLLFDECLAEVEEQTLADELFQDMMHHLEVEDDNDSNNMRDSLASGSVQKKFLDRRTVSWVRRSIGVGLRKRNVPSRFQQHLLAHNAGRVTTRGTAKSQSKLKKSRQDLNILHDVVQEIAKERGRPFRLTKSSAGRRSVSSMYRADDEVSKATKVGSKKGNVRSKSESSRHKKVSRVGSTVTSASAQTGVSARSSKSKRKRSGDIASASASSKRRKQEAKAKGRPMIDIEKLEAQRWILVRQQALSRRKNSSYECRTKTALPEEYKKMGIIHRLPNWSRYSKNILVPRKPMLDGATTSQISDQGSRKMPSKRKFLRNAICSSFISEIDRAWCDKAWELSGQIREEGAFVASAEWKRQRKRRHNRIRRFSKQFVKDQVAERNDYRQAVRLLQQSPELMGQIVFPYVVTSPFRPGVRVAVALRAHRMVEHGTVIKHEPKRSEYLISFDRQGLGFAFYPDVDVTSQWTCDLTSYDMAKQSLATKTGESQVFSGDPSGGLAVGETLRKAVMFHSSQIPESQLPSAVKFPAESSSAVSDVHNDTLHKVAERQALVVLMGSIVTALGRKDKLVEALEEMNELTTTPQQPDQGKTQLKSHRLWLEHCIRHTTWMLDRQLDYLEVLYGTAYLPKENAVHQISELNRGDVTNLLAGIATKSCDPTTKASLDQLLQSITEINFKLIGSTTIDMSLDMAMELLMSLSFASSMASEPLAIAIAQYALEALSADREPVAVDGDDDPLLTQVQCSREEAMQEFQDAVKQLQIEIGLSKLSSGKLPL